MTGNLEALEPGFGTSPSPKRSLQPTTAGVGYRDTHR